MDGNPEAEVAVRLVLKGIGTVEKSVKLADIKTGGAR